MNRIILFAVSFFAVSAAWAQPASTAAPSGSTETTTGDSVPIEEYVPKIIIEGKWGTGPGEFGAVSQFPLVASEKKYQPSSLAVDNKGNIYVLDTANNRIEKFNKDGKYLTSLVVESLKGEIAGYCVGKPGEGYCNEEPPEPGMKYDVPIMGAVEVEGINIVIDSKDTLFYYLKRVKDGKETGEVWEFKKDKLVKKNKKDVKDIDDPKNPRGVSPDQHPARDLILADIIKDAAHRHTAVEKEEKKTLQFKLRDDEDLPGFAVYNKKERIWKIGVKRNNKYWHRTYDSVGVAVKETESPNLFLSQFGNRCVDNKGNYYCLDIRPSAIIIWKYELMRVKK